MKRLYCHGKKDYCEEHEECRPSCRFYDESGSEFITQQTNGDRIRAMSDEELAKLLVIEVNGVFPCSLYMAINSENQYLVEKLAVNDALEWIRQPANKNYAPD